MQSTYVNSSNIQRIGWNRGKLFIRFNSGVSYSYDAPHQTYALLESAEREDGSVGKTFHRFVRSKYRYERLDHDPFKEART